MDSSSNCGLDWLKLCFVLIQACICSTEVHLHGIYRRFHHGHRCCANATHTTRGMAHLLLQPQINSPWTMKCHHSKRIISDEMHYKRHFIIICRASILRWLQQSPTNFTCILHIYIHVYYTLHSHFIFMSHNCKEPKTCSEEIRYWNVFKRGDVWYQRELVSGNGLWKENIFSLTIFLKQT